MPITDKVAAAKQIGEFLQAVISNGGFKLSTALPSILRSHKIASGSIPKYCRVCRTRFLLVARARRRVAALVRTPGVGNPAPPGQRAREDLVRLQEFPRHANRRVAAGRAGCRRTGSQDERTLPLGPMSSRERRIVHLALREEKDLRTESDGEGGRRSVVVYPQVTNRAPGKTRTPPDFLAKVGREVIARSFSRGCTLCAAVISRHLTAQQNRRFDSRSRKSFLLPGHRRAIFFMLLCGSSRNEFHRQPVRQNSSSSALK